MNNPSPLTDQERENLVAYLDGELQGPAAREWEARLGRDEGIRAEADALQRAWEMLDFLPRPQPSPDFAAQTLSRLSPASKSQTFHRLRRSLLAAGWAASLLLAGWMGYRSYPWLAPPQPGDAELIRDLRIIEHKRLYETVDDIDFLRALDHPDLFGDDPSAS